MRRPLAALVPAALAATLTLMLTGCGSAGPTVDEACTKAIKAKEGSAFTGFKVTMTEDRASEADVRGTYDGGEFACGLSKNPLKVEQAIVYLDSGDVKTVIP